MTSPILWQNKDRTISLIDIPTSLVAAQGGDSAYSSHLLLSSAPLLSPFPSNEPKTPSARSKVNVDPADDTLHAEYQQLLQRAIDETQKNYAYDWCLPRPFVEPFLPLVKKRRLEDSNLQLHQKNTLALPNDFLPNLARQALHGAQDVEVSLPPRTTTEQKCNEHLNNDAGSKGVALSNNSSQTATLQLTSNKTQEDFSFHVPAYSSFYLGDCTNSKAFRETVRKHAEVNGTRSNFDFIVLDPPWPNRSVKRTHKTPGSTYSTSPSLEDIGDLILDTHLEILMEEECLVGIWITNKPAIRELVLGENGIFDCWDIDLVEEWIWLKTTVNGEPVTPLDGLWRKPYEVLLLGSRRRKDKPSRKEQTLPRDVERRVIIGVPDLHSRKPCLKALIEPSMANPAQYRALEVFARHLVAGWCSWGDECIKFIWDGYWRQHTDE